MREQAAFPSSDAGAIFGSYADCDAAGADCAADGAECDDDGVVGVGVGDDGYDDDGVVSVNVGGDGDADEVEEVEGDADADAVGGEACCASARTRTWTSIRYFSPSAVENARFTSAIVAFTPSGSERRSPSYSTPTHPE